MELLVLFFSTTGTVISIILTLSPFPSIVRAFRSQSLVEISHLYLLISEFNALIWILYAFKSENYVLLIPNGTNLIVNFVFLTSYHLIEKSLLRFSVQYLIAVTAITNLFIFIVPLPMIGISCVVFNFTSYLAPIEQLSSTISEKNPRYIDIVVIVACLLNSTFWAVYGTLISDIYVIMPNCGGAIVSTLIITVYLWANETLPHGTFGYLHELKKEKQPLKI